MIINYTDGYYEGHADFFDQPHGYGAMYWDDGCQYIGYWQNGKRHGQGEFIWPDGAYYKGEWRNDEMHGRGKIVWSDGEWFEGQWEYGNRIYGTWHFTSGSKYVGMFKDNRICGHGIMYLRDGSSYEGDWWNEENATNVIYKHGSIVESGKIITYNFFPD
jgi:hypothetical protein